MLVRIYAQVTNELRTANEHPAKLFGFVGACCNWFLGLSAVYDASNKGAEVISLPMTCAAGTHPRLRAEWTVCLTTPGLRMDCVPAHFRGLL